VIKLFSVASKARRNHNVPEFELGESEKYLS